MGVRLIQEFMTADPVRVPPTLLVLEAHELMRRENVRHLVVMEGERLVGVVSQRDLYLIETFAQADPQNAAVEEAMTPDPYTVAPMTPLDEVARTMWRDRLGSVVIAEDDRVVGIFTAVDALRALSEVVVRDEANHAPH